MSARHIARSIAEDGNLLIKTFGATDDELGNLMNGIQNTINSHPRINSGHLYSFLTVVRTKSAVQIKHTSSKKMICEVLIEK
jgi:hypothetical protein